MWSARRRWASRDAGLPTVKVGAQTEGPPEVATKIYAVSAEDQRAAAERIEGSEVPEEDAEAIAEYVDYAEQVADLRDEISKLMKQAANAYASNDVDKANELVKQIEATIAKDAKLLDKAAKAVKGLGFKECAQE